MEIGRQLNCDFIDHNGYYLIVNRDGGLSPGDLNSIQIQMMQSNVIPRHLPMEVEEIDMSARLCYDISGKRALSNVARGRRLKKDEYARLFINLLTAIEQSVNYMLDENNYLLDSNYVFVGNDPTDVHLVYLPVQETQGSLYQNMVKLVQEMAAVVDDMDRQEVNRILQWLYAHQDGFSTRIFKQSLIQGSPAQAPSAPAAGPTPQNTPHPGYPSQPGSHHQAAAARDAIPPMPPQAGAKPAAGVLPKATPPPKQKKTKAPSGPVPKSSAEPLSERTRVIIGCIAFIVIAFIWKTYTSYPSEGFLYVSVGLTFLVVDAVYVLFKLWKPAVPGTAPAAPAAAPQMPFAPQKAAAVPVQVQPQVVPPVQPQAPPLYNQQPNPPQPQPPVMNQDYYQDLQNKTSFLGGNDETTVLKQQPQAAPAQPDQAWLEIDRGIKTDHIPIRGNSFAIGRNAKEVQHVEESTEVSRLHCEIIRAGEGWSIKDRDSKNFTYLNGQKLIPNKLYPLTSGDFIRVANIEYTFVIGPGRNA